jgi:hypothetical protein
MAGPATFFCTKAGKKKISSEGANAQSELRVEQEKKPRENESGPKSGRRRLQLLVAVASYSNTAATSCNTEGCAAVRKALAG